MNIFSYKWIGLCSISYRWCMLGSCSMLLRDDGCWFGLVWLFWLILGSMQHIVIIFYFLFFIEVAWSSCLGLFFLVASSLFGPSLVSLLEVLVFAWF